MAAGSRLAAVALVLEGCELLLARRSMGRGGLLDWGVLRLISGRMSAPLARVLRYPTVLSVIVAELLCAAVLLASPASVWALSAGLAAHSALGVRHELSKDGSDDMVSVVLGACLVAALLPGRAPQVAAVAFVAAQASLSYLTSGISKAQSRQWWDGSALTGILSTRIFGWPAAASRLGCHQRLGRAAARFVIVWESLFVVALPAPRPVLISMVTVALLFHVSCAVTMGLNTFVYAFAAAYPALLATGSLIARVVPAAGRAALVGVGLAAVGAAVSSLYRLNGRAPQRPIQRSAGVPPG